MHRFLTKAKRHPSRRRNSWSSHLCLIRKQKVMSHEIQKRKQRKNTKKTWLFSASLSFNSSPCIRVSCLNCKSQPPRKKRPQETPDFVETAEKRAETLLFIHVAVDFLQNGCWVAKYLLKRPVVCWLKNKHFPKSDLQKTYCWEKWTKKKHEIFSYRKSIPAFLACLVPYNHIFTSQHGEVLCKRPPGHRKYHPLADLWSIASNHLLTKNEIVAELGRFFLVT